ncbi:hypothetical protein BDA99DRAFT_569122 [Phascolomyces articulosus]|uniref:Uncharacterized protein n=1 Tax=Phascolomyces articulosus TaxID=60185 RepID=A0AAD5KJF8_9FUNG|nr:hypothetical protein BDA99DRAFT_569122 [Phascolomyces articulosus]
MGLIKTVHIADDVSLILMALPSRHEVKSRIIGLTLTGLYCLVLIANFVFKFVPLSSSFWTTNSFLVVGFKIVLLDVGIIYSTFSIPISVTVFPLSLTRAVHCGNSNQCFPATMLDTTTQENSTVAQMIIKEMQHNPLFTRVDHIGLLAALFYDRKPEYGAKKYVASHDGNSLLENFISKTHL